MQLYVPVCGMGQRKASLLPTKHDNLPNSCDCFTKFTDKPKSFTMAAGEAMGVESPTKAYLLLNSILLVSCVTSAVHGEMVLQWS